MCTGQNFPEEENTTFGKELERLINKYSIENESNTPDYILAQYLRGCLDAYSSAITQRDRWYGFSPW